MSHRISQVEQQLQAARVAGDRAQVRRLETELDALWEARRRHHAETQRASDRWEHLDGRVFRHPSIRQPVFDAAAPAPKRSLSADARALQRRSDEVRRAARAARDPEQARALHAQADQLLDQVEQLRRATP